MLAAAVAEVEFLGVENDPPLAARELSAGRSGPRFRG